MPGRPFVGGKAQNIIVMAKSPWQRGNEIGPPRKNYPLLFRFDLEDQQAELGSAIESARRSAPADQHVTTAKASLPENRRGEAQYNRESRG